MDAYLTSLIVGIDPDVERSGVARVLRNERKLLMVASEDFATLADELRYFGKNEVLIVVEASWLTTHNWHLPRYCSPSKAAAMGRSVGMNHATGKNIVSLARSLGLHVVEQPPLTKCWRGKDGKITHAELAQFVTGLPRRTNQEERDAVLLAWTAAGLPIRVKYGRQKD